MLSPLAVLYVPDLSLIRVYLFSTRQASEGHSRIGGPLELIQRGGSKHNFVEFQVTTAMPIKLPKSFNRRKSSGNVLEDVEAPQSSFRVFERPGPQRSMTDGAPLTKRFSEGNVVPSMLEDDNMFAETERPLQKHRYDRPSTMDSLRKRLTGRRDSGNYEL